MGLRTFLKVREFLLYNCSAVCGPSAQRLYDGSHWVTQFCCRKSPCSCGKPLLIHASTGDTQTLKGGSGSVSLGPLDPGAPNVLFNLSPPPHPPEFLAVMGFDSKHDFATPIVFRGFSFALGCGVSFFGGIQHSPVDSCSAMSCNFGALTGEDECISFYSASL